MRKACTVDYTLIQAKKSMQYWQHLENNSGKMLYLCINQPQWHHGCRPPRTLCEMHLTLNFEMQSYK